MREITKIMIEKYRLKKLKYDMMGYMFKRTQDLSFHHTIISHKDCKELGLGEGYWEWNEVILNAKTSHPELHLVEAKEEKMFQYITSEFIDMKIKEYLDIQNIKRIQEILLEFEYKYRNATDRKGRLLIKKEYIEGKANII